MTDIIELAKKVDLITHYDSPSSWTVKYAELPKLEAFAKLIAAECAGICEGDGTTAERAAAIRERFVIKE